MLCTPSGGFSFNANRAAAHQAASLPNLFCDQMRVGPAVRFIRIEGPPQLPGNADQREVPCRPRLAVSYRRWRPIPAASLSSGRHSCCAGVPPLVWTTQFLASPPSASASSSGPSARILPSQVSRRAQRSNKVSTASRLPHSNFNPSVLSGPRAPLPRPRTPARRRKRSGCTRCRDR